MIDVSDKQAKLALAIGICIVTAYVGLTIASFGLDLRLRTHSKSQTRDEPVRTPDVSSAVPYSAALARELANTSAFDLPVGGLLGGIVPVEDVPVEERADVRKLCEKVVAADFLPTNNESVEWRKICWWRVQWPERERRSKSPSPSVEEACFARWVVDGMPLVVSPACVTQSRYISLTIQLAGEDRLRIEYPRPHELPPQTFKLVLKDQIDKQRLLEILTTCFRFPWRSVDEFDVVWGISATTSGHFRIESTRPRKPGEPVRAFDEVALGVKHGDPQELTITLLLPK